MKTICIYNYFEKDDSYKQNCKYFLKHGLNDASDFLFIVNGESTLEFPQKKNIAVIYRENIGYDFMAWAHALNRINIMNYDYFLFINTSVRGPYIKDTSKWQETFTNMIRGDVKLVGTTVSILLGKPECNWPEVETKLNNLGLKKPYNHVQSMMFAMDRECLLYLKSRIFQEVAFENFQDTIIYREIWMSQLVIQNKWNIDCMAPLYRGLDYRILDKDINFSSICGDPSYKGCYFGNTMKPEEVVFIKTNRDIYEPYENAKKNYIVYFLIALLISLAMCFVVMSR